MYTLIIAITVKGNTHLYLLLYCMMERSFFATFSIISEIIWILFNKNQNKYSISAPFMVNYLREKITVKPRHFIQHKMKIYAGTPTEGTFPQRIVINQQLLVYPGDVG